MKVDEDFSYNEKNAIKILPKQWNLDVFNTIKMFIFQFKLRVEMQKPSINTLNIMYKRDQSFTKSGRKVRKPKNLKNYLLSFYG